MTRLRLAWGVHLRDCLVWWVARDGSSSERLAVLAVRDAEARLRLRACDNRLLPAKGVG